MNTDQPDHELRPEYGRENHQSGVRGKYLEQYRGGTNLALLAPDVRAAGPPGTVVAFPTSSTGLPCDHLITPEHRCRRRNRHE